MSKPSNTLVARYDDCGVDAAPDFGAQRPRRRKGKATREQPTLADRTRGDPRWRTDPGTPWARWRGRGRRGRVRPADDDDFDLKLAIGELVEAREMLRVAYTIEPNRKDSSARKAAVATAIGRVALAGRVIDALCARRTGLGADCLPTRKRP